MSSGSFKNNELFAYKSYICVCVCVCVCVCKQDLALNNPQELIFHRKTTYQLILPFFFLKYFMFTVDEYFSFFFQWHTKLCGLFSVKAILVEEQ